MSRTHKRLRSMDDHLSGLRRRLGAKQAEDTREIERAFTAALLQLYEDPAVGGPRSKSDRSAMRAASIEAYGSRPAQGEAWSDDVLWCPLVGRFLLKADVIAGAIVPSSLGAGLVDYLCGEGSGARLHTADNCLMMHRRVERAFNHGSFVIIPVDPTERPISRWKCVVVNPDAHHHFLFEPSAPSPQTVRDLDGRELQFRTPHRPAARFMYYHFLITMLRIRRSNRPRWPETWARLVTGRPFATPGPYLRRSMMLCLARQIGDVKDEELDALLPLGTGFESAERWSGVDETLIATRVQAVAEREIERRARADEKAMLFTSDDSGGDGDGDGHSDGDIR
ncbi:MAG: hypothetical protein M1826_007097 [Phylliscum demangeonii]|nr:MAG: hypothetical protein M1826_007097 [Phylliscum demangeonii]